MKTKLSATLVIIGIVFLMIFTFTPSDKKEKVVKEKIAMNFIKCTPAKFLLENVDTTKQISPIFDNLGNHSMAISTKDKISQRFFDQGLNLTYAFKSCRGASIFYGSISIRSKCGDDLLGAGLCTGSQTLMILYPTMSVRNKRSRRQKKLTTCFQMRLQKKKL